MASGIYLLKFKELDKVYIGKSVDINSRTKKHLSNLRSGIHYNKALQSAYLNYGMPEVEILEEVSPILLNEREVYWIAKFNSFKNGLNSTVGGDGGSMGEDNIRAKYDKDTYLLILELLANTDWTTKDIANELEVSWDVVSHISTNSSHKYLAEEYPELHAKMMSNSRPDSKCKYSKSTYIDILKLLADNKLTQEEIATKLQVSLSVVINLSSGITHKYLADEYPELYLKMKNKKVSSILSPDGVLHTVTKAKDFAELHKLSRGHLSQVLSGKLKQHKGWTLP